MFLVVVRSVRDNGVYAQRGELLLHNHPSGVLEPSGADLHVAARLHDEGIGLGIISNDASERYVVVEVPREQQRVRVDPFDARNLAVLRQLRAP